MASDSIVSKICDQADDFLAGVSKRDEARAGIAEWLTINYLKMPPEEKKAIIREVMGHWSGKSSSRPTPVGMSEHRIPLLPQRAPSSPNTKSPIRLRKGRKARRAISHRRIVLRGLGELGVKCRSLRRLA